MKPKTPAILSALFLTLCANHGFAQTPKTDSHQTTALAAVKIGDKWGYIDRTGMMVIQPQFSRADDFSDGLAYVFSSDKRGFIDKTGTMVIPQPWPTGAFSEGLAIMPVGDKVGYMDVTGKMVIAPQFGGARPFSDGLANVTVDGFKQGYIDKAGTMVIAPQLPWGPFSEFREGLAAVNVGHKWGYIDKTGTMVITLQFDSADSFSEQLAVVN